MTDKLKKVLEVKFCDKQGGNVAIWVVPPAATYEDVREMCELQEELFGRTQAHTRWEYLAIIGGKRFRR